MNDRAGLCVPKDGSFEPSWGTGLGAGWYRFSGDLDYGAPREWAQACVDAGLKLKLDYDSDTFRNRTDEQAIEALAQRYGGLIEAVGNGNEPDGSGSESSSMSHSRINRLMEISRYYWGDSQILTTPGLISGDENWLDGMDFTHVNWVDIHPYGQWAPGVDHSQGAFFGYLGDIIDRYFVKANALAGRFIPICASEFGISTWEVSEDTQALYVGSAMDYLIGRADKLVMATTFAFHDHAGFGILRPDGSWKPSLYSWMAAANGYWAPELGQMQRATRSQPLALVNQWSGRG